MSATSRQKINKLNYHENICLLSDEDLRRLFLNVRTQINKSRRKRSKSRDLEIELCYIQKEIQDRRECRRKK
mgnify:CR=1 FL=1